MKDLLEMDDMFLPYDHTKQQDETIVAQEDDDLISERRNSLTPTSLLRRVGGALDQNRYNSKGYHELAEDVVTTAA